MTVINVYYMFGDSVNIRLVDENGMEIARYDGKDSIPSECNNMTVIQGNVVWNDKTLELTVKRD